jgi:hypothetical protein
MPNFSANGPNTYGDVIQGLTQLNPSSEGINTIEDIRKRFGLTASPSTAFGSARKNLASQKARTLASTSARMSSRVANPEAIFSGVEGDYANAEGNLEGQQANAELGQQMSFAQMLQSMLQGRDAFNLNKSSQMSQNVGGALQQQNYEESKPGVLDDFLAILKTVGGTAAGAATGAGALGWKPFGAKPS